MPGLIGIFHKDAEPIDLNLFDSMISSVNHRKIYEKTIEIDKNNHYTIADIKLPILKNRKQPFISNDGKVKILMHGEIYNEDIDELSQLEYIHRLYQNVDLRFPERLNGSFLIFIIDEVRQRIVIANDRTASRPLFYFITGQALYCAPELKALLKLPLIRKKLNLSAVASFLSCGYLLDGETWIENIKSLDNATILVFSNEGAQFIKYWNFVFDEDAKDLGVKYYQEMLSELISKSVKNRIRTNHKYGILLSGGYDSRGILGCVLREKDSGEIKTISWGNNEYVNDSDCAIAERLAKKLGVHHTFYRLDSEKLTEGIKDFVYLSDGITDAFTNYPESLKVFEKIRDDIGVDMLLRGDECFGWLATAFDEKTMFQTLGIYPLNELDRFQKIIDSETMSVLGRSISERIDKLSKKVAFRNIHNRKDFFYLDQRLKCYLNPLSYVKRIEIELRNPFVDNNIFDFLTLLPEKYRIGKNLYIKTIREMFPDIFTEMAYKSNMIDWQAELEESRKLKLFLEDEFSKRSSVVYELINFENFKELLNENSKETKQMLIGRQQARWIKKYPRAYKAMKYFQAYLRERVGGKTIVVRKGVVVRRVLTLKIWCDLFLEGEARGANGANG